jgi:hypothetical protein
MILRLKKEYSKFVIKSTKNAKIITRLDDSHYHPLSCAISFTVPGKDNLLMELIGSDKPFQ